MLINAISSAQFGIQYQLQRFAEAADRIANPDIIAGIEEITQLKQAEVGVRVNAAVIRTANEMSDAMLNMLG